ncbi:hypothetical protein BQ8482_430009 [Mesorhizobium delmotii]|uniref:Uncharacterized protein n=1 Tax=Mesorhizobium delmotii TaxID=1631247 RepID=A0A2P9ATB9_9HYPH|nr:hypothetical protein BQ8482_430009 [Mesorhizobium delmotii]
MTPEQIVTAPASIGTSFGSDYPGSKQRCPAGLDRPAFEAAKDLKHVQAYIEQFQATTLSIGPGRL